jgi:signal peptidase I
VTRPSSNGARNLFVATPAITRPIVATPTISARPDVPARPSPFVGTSGLSAGPDTTIAPSPDVAVVRRRRRGWRLAIEWGMVLLVAVAVAFGIRTFVVQTFYIPSQSMEPTLMVGDRILVDKLSYHLHAVHRGDIVVFGKPALETTPGVTDLVKRVIGLPGDTVSSQDGRVYIDNKPLAEPWLPSGTVTSGITTQTLGPNEYFVMGDNRGDSSDSRVFGPIPGSLIIGRVVVRIWPVLKFHIF